MRVYVSVSAGAIGTILHNVGLADTDMAKGRMGTIRSHLLKPAGHIKATVRRVRLALPEAFVHRELFELALGRLCAAVHRPAQPGHTECGDAGCDWTRRGRSVVAWEGFVGGRRRGQTGPETAVYGTTVTLYVP